MTKPVLRIRGRVDAPSRVRASGVRHVQEGWAPIPLPRLRCGTVAERVSQQVDRDLGTADVV
jgi:hypothetical protein